MAGATPPGCRGCRKTTHGGQTRPVGDDESGPYEVRDEAGVPLKSFASAVAAATFMRGHPRSKLHTTKD